MARIPWSTIDPNMIKLIKTLNKYPALQTIGSCGGHETPQPGQWDINTWYLLFELDKNKTGWRVLEFLSWAINNDFSRAGHEIMLLPKSPPPWLNIPGQCLRFAIECTDGTEPDHVAKYLDEWRKNYLILDDPDAATP